MKQSPELKYLRHIFREIAGDDSLSSEATAESKQPQRFCLLVGVRRLIKKETDSYYTYVAAGKKQNIVQVGQVGQGSNLASGIQNLKM